MNKVILMGRLVADPELKTTPSGISVTSFRIAVDRNYVKQGEERQADFIDIVYISQATKEAAAPRRAGIRRRLRRWKPPRPLIRAVRRATLRKCLWTTIYRFDQTSSFFCDYL